MYKLTQMDFPDTNLHFPTVSDGKHASLSPYNQHLMSTVLVPNDPSCANVVIGLYRSKMFSIGRRALHRLQSKTSNTMISMFRTILINSDF